MVYEIISTGSRGNCVVLNNTIAIDMGVPFSKLKHIYTGLSIVLLTHCHSDHINLHTIATLACERPTLRFGCPEWLSDKLADIVEPFNIDIYDMDKLYRYNGLGIIKAHRLKHNVPNCAYSIELMRGERVFYATDTNSLNGIQAKNYDFYFVEANYSENDIKERIKNKENSGQYCYEWNVLNNHLSKEKADEFLYRNMNDRSQYVYLHGHMDKARNIA